MKTYPLRKVARSSQLFDILSLDRTLTIGVSCFFAVLCVGIIYFGRSNNFLTFCLVLSTYAGFLGFLFARTTYKRILKSQQDYTYLSFLSKSDSLIELIVDVQEQNILFQNKAFDNNKRYTARSINDFVDSLGLHSLDRTTISRYFKENLDLPFKAVFKRNKSKQGRQFISFQCERSSIGDQKFIIIRINDITSEQNITLTQNQYIKDMEDIIQNQRPQTPLHFLSQMATAREMSQPLKMVQSYVRLIESNYKEKLDENGRNYVNKISTETYKLQALIQDMFAITGIDQEDLKEERVNLNDVLTQVFNNLEFKIKKSEAKIKYPKLPVVQADRNQLILLFQNLIENAINYCGSQAPKIQLDWHQERSHWVFSVSDQGMGIGPKFKQQIFEYLNRGQIITGIKGIGLGLAICKQIVQNHNGEIWVESQGAGKGASFCFSLPMQEEARLLRKKEVAGQPMAVSA